MNDVQNDGSEDSRFRLLRSFRDFFHGSCRRDFPFANFFFFSKCGRHNRKKNKEMEKTRKRTHERAGLKVRISKMDKMFRRNGTARRVSVDAKVFLAGTMENLVSTFVEEVVRQTESQKKHRVQPRHILLASKDPVNSNFDELFGPNTIVGAGIVPSAASKS